MSQNQQRPPDNYYLNYFRQMIDLVRQRYDDILSDAQREFIAALDQASEPALRLLIRLYLRKGPNFLVEKLNYAEVPDLTASIEELVELQLIELDPVVYAYELVELLPIAQARTLFSEDARCKKAELIEAWFDDETLMTCSDWQVNDAIIAPCHYQEFRRIQLLYFGNERQSLTEFILEDLGLFRFENYQLDKDNRLFNSPEEVEALIEHNDLRDEFYLINQAKDWSGLIAFSERVLALPLSDRLINKKNKLINQVAYRLEQLGELTLAEQLFSTNEQPPARERLTRIYYKQERFEHALKQLEAINAQPLSADEQQFYQRFINKTYKKLKQKPIIINKPNIPNSSAAWVNDGRAVELQAVDYFGNAVWLENHLPMAIFGLIHWPMIFADVSGVWHHPFQSAPTDLYDIDFCQRRSVPWQKIKKMNKAQLRAELIANWQNKLGINNPFVQWKHLQLDWLLRCFDALSLDQWFGIFNHLLADLKRHRSGFPDLFQQQDDRYRFIEIKGPGDKLQDNQIHWIDVFQSLNIEVEVCYVEYLEP